MKVSLTCSEFCRNITVFIKAIFMIPKPEPLIEPQMSFPGKQVRTGNTATPAGSVTICVYPLLPARPAQTVMCL